MEGSVWAMAESIQVGELEGTTSPVPLPPAVVTQHTLPAREFVVIGTKGSYLFSCLRPVEQLRHLLSKSRGGASPAVEDFFKLHRVCETLHQFNKEGMMEGWGVRGTAVQSYA